jgi:hypothetical protein
MKNLQEILEEFSTRDKIEITEGAEKLIEEYKQQYLKEQ